MQEMRAEKEAAAAETAAAAGLVLAPRPAHWTPPQDATALVEYVGHERHRGCVADMQCTLYFDEFP